VSANDTNVDAPGSSRSSSRLLLLLLIVVLAAAAVAAALWLTGGDDPEPAPVAAAPSAAAGADTDDAPGSDATTDTAEPVASSELPVVTYEVFLSRDPFQPVVPEDVQQTGANPTDPGTSTDPADPDDATDTDDSSDPEDPDGSNGSGSSGGSTTDARACSSRGELVCDGQVVTLIDVTTRDDGERIAVIQIDTTIYEVQRGQTFAGSYQLRAIDGACVSLLYGDEAFQLCTGDTVLK
jgi:hypothetical protein